MNLMNSYSACYEFGEVQSNRSPICYWEVTDKKIKIRVEDIVTAVETVVLHQE